MNLYFQQKNNKYFTGSAGMDAAQSTYEWSKPQCFYPIQLYDENFNLLKEYKFDSYVLDISFFNGTYYCYLPPHSTFGGNLQATPERYMSSTDFENWSSIEGSIAKSNDIATYKIENSEQYPLKEPLKNSVNISDDIFLPIFYEENNIKYTCNQFGNWIVKRDVDNNFYPRIIC